MIVNRNFVDSYVNGGRRLFVFCLKRVGDKARKHSSGNQNYKGYTVNAHAWWENGPLLTIRAKITNEMAPWHPKYCSELPLKLSYILTFLIYFRNYSPDFNFPFITFGYKIMFAWRDIFNYYKWDSTLTS